MSADGWTPVSDPAPPDDFHSWARPPMTACPRCSCCTELLCQTAAARGATCGAVGQSGSGILDVSACPCSAAGGGR